MEWMKALTLRVTFEAQEEGKLPEYLGSTIRGILGHCLRSFVCDAPEEKCFRCGKRGECLYVRCFSNTGGEAGAINPYVLYVHTQGKTCWRPGDTCTVDLTLFGVATSWANIYLDALFEMEHCGWGAGRMKFRLLRVIEPHAERVIYASGKIWLRNAIPYNLECKEREAGTALVVFDTPVRIVSGKELCEELPCDVLIKFLYGRISLLSRVYGQGELPWKEDMLCEAATGISVRAQEWKQVDFTRYSMTQTGNKVELPSKLGWVLYEGDLTKLVSLLEAGRYVHVGKGTTIGFGHYKVFFDK